MPPPHTPRRSALFWVGRYGPQDLVAAAAAFLWCCAIEGRGHTAAAIGLTTAAVETGTFYAVAFARTPGASLRPAGVRAGLRALIAEYGLAELLDLVLRPGLMTLAVSFVHPPVGVLLGSIAADIAFYTLAARGWVRRGRTFHREC